MAEEGVASSEPAYMDDIKELKSSISSTNDSMSELREIMMSFMQANKSPIPPTTTTEVGNPSLDKTSLGAPTEAETKEEDGSGESSRKIDPNATGVYSTVAPPLVYSPDPPIPHPRINPRGDPPSLNPNAFSLCQTKMKSYLNSSSIELWIIVVEGYKPHNPNGLSCREVVDFQLNATALYMIQQAVSDDDRPYIEKATTAKDAWDIPDEVFLGSSSMRQNKFQEVSNKSKGFYMEDGEHHRDMYRRLKALAISFRDLGATYVDDDWIKRKYINALLPFEPADLRILKNKHNFEQMTSNDVMQEMDAFKVESKIAVDSRDRAIGMKRSENLALKAHVCVEDEEDLRETKEDHSGKLILKDKSKAPRKKPFFKKSGYDICKKPSKYVLIAPEEYSSEEEDDKDDSRSKVAAIAITSTPSSSLFESPNEDSSNNARCFMVKTSHVLTSGDEEDVHEDTLSEKATSASTPMTSLFESPNENLSFNLNTCFMAKTSELSGSDVGSDDEHHDTKTRQVMRRLQVGQYISYFAKGVYRCPFCTRRLGGTDFNCLLTHAENIGNTFPKVGTTVNQALGMHLRSFQRVEISAGRMPPLKPKVPKWSNKWRQSQMG
ncbi:hypothetical protein QYE76_047995 [Lolium multiflorum]|uniref:Uncharacterized protein n=1 Tax=Lolium multiflorum TaxID=4521 RepID=A0AAD8TT18_LOLMU|nr:hypothetical protein QYE76_047995 [Lolium multiflorum]